MGTAVMEMLGGYKLFRRKIANDLDLDVVVRAGLPVKALDHLLRELVGEFVSQADVYQVIGSARTLQRKRSQGTALSPEESDRLTRLARMTVRAEEALGSGKNARSWLATGNRALGGRTPISLLGSDAGTLAVERVLGRIEHGIYS
jgi:putative toxin-antitoxin system antitoxin component (TIGR02293 family)